MYYVYVHIHVDRHILPCVCPAAPGSSTKNVFTRLLKVAQHCLLESGKYGAAARSSTAKRSPALGLLPKTRTSTSFTQAQVHLILWPASFEIKNNNALAATPLPISERRNTVLKKKNQKHFLLCIYPTHISLRMYVIQGRTRRSSSRRSQNSTLGGVKEQLPSQDSDGGATEDRCVREIKKRGQTICPLLYSNIIILAQCFNWLHYLCLIKKKCLEVSH